MLYCKIWDLKSEISDQRSWITVADQRSQIWDARSGIVDLIPVICDDIFDPRYLIWDLSIIPNIGSHSAISEASMLEIFECSKVHVFTNPNIWKLKVVFWLVIQGSWINVWKFEHEWIGWKIVLHVPASSITFPSCIKTQNGFHSSS